jgi:hypothetical protein
MRHRCDSRIINYLTLMTLNTPEMTGTKSKFRSKFRFRRNSVRLRARNIAGILNLECSWYGKSDRERDQGQRKLCCMHRRGMKDCFLLWWIWFHKPVCWGESSLEYMFESAPKFCPKISTVVSCWYQLHLIDFYYQRHILLIPVQSCTSFAATKPSFVQMSAK